MSGEIVEFPGREPPPEGYSEQYIDKLHSEAFRDLEMRICDCAAMGKIAAQMVAAEDNGTDRELLFAVCHVSEMLAALKASYYAAWHGEAAP
jgi:hypothetical protein